PSSHSQRFALFSPNYYSGTTWLGLIQKRHSETTRLANGFRHKALNVNPSVSALQLVARLDTRGTSYCIMDNFCTNYIFVFCTIIKKLVLRSKIYSQMVSLE